VIAGVRTVLRVSWLPLGGISSSAVGEVAAGAAPGQGRRAQHYPTTGGRKGVLSEVQDVADRVAVLGAERVVDTDDVYTLRHHAGSRCSCASPGRWTCPCLPFAWGAGRRPRRCDADLLAAG